MNFPSTPCEESILAAHDDDVETHQHAEKQILNDDRLLFDHR